MKTRAHLPVLVWFALGVGCGDASTLVCETGCGSAALTFASSMSSAAAIDTLDLGTIAGRDATRFVFIRNDGPAGTHLTLQSVAVVDATGRLTVRVEDATPMTLPAFSGAMPDVAIVQITAEAGPTGPVDGELVVEAELDGTASTYALPIVGEVVAGELGLWPSTLAIEAVAGRTATKMLLVRNDGAAPLDVTDLAVEDATSFTLAAHDAPPFALDTDEAMMLALTFSPTEEGHRATAVTITTGDGVVHRVPVDGLALAPPVAVFEATRLDFGDVGVGALHTRQLTITNTGGADLLIVPPSVVEDPRETFSSHVDDTVVLPGQRTTLTVQLQPDALGVTRGIVRVQTDDPAAAKVYIEVVARVIIY